MVRPRIAVFAGAGATILNTPPPVTSDKARVKYGLQPRSNPDGSPPRFDVLRPQRLAAPVRVLVEQFSAHPLEADRADLFGPPDGYVDSSGSLRPERSSETDVPVYEVELRPEDGLYLLPYMARTAQGSAWEDDRPFPEASADQVRQPHFPDASRLVEEIDRFGLSNLGSNGMLSALADFDYFRPVPSGGYTRGLREAERTDHGVGDIAPERVGEDFFVYRPHDLRSEPPLSALARLTNSVHKAMATGKYAGAVWLEGSPYIEETSYWLNLLIDTEVPIVANASHRLHGALSNDGDRNLVDAVDYICSGIWKDGSGRDGYGVVLIQDEQIMSAREAHKVDARPGGFVVGGGHGGIVGTMGNPGRARMTFTPVRRHTWTSRLRLQELPTTVDGAIANDSGRPEVVAVRTRDDTGDLIEGAMPIVTIVKHSRYNRAAGTAGESSTESRARVIGQLIRTPLAGIVAEGGAPYGRLDAETEAALRYATLTGIPVVHVGRGDVEGFVPDERLDLAVGGNNLTSTKARILLIAAILRLGALPPAVDPESPTSGELRAIRSKLDEYQSLFDEH